MIPTSFDGVYRSRSSDNTQHCCDQYALTICTLIALTSQSLLIKLNEIGTNQQNDTFPKI